MKFIDLFAGLGGFHAALATLGHECVFASELDPELRALYEINFPDARGRVFGDIRHPAVKRQIPAHDILCAGFPCQPFSKSGGQQGIKDPTRGTLFHEILEILEARMPAFVLLENVGNFPRHDHGNTWIVVRNELKRLGYMVQGSEHRTPRSRIDWRDSGHPEPKRVPPLAESRLGQGLISPHHFGFPHHRERFFIVASRGPLPDPPFPVASASSVTSIGMLAQSRETLQEVDVVETRLSSLQVRCIEHWNQLLRSIPEDVSIPSFPLWGDELGARYPFEDKSPWAMRPIELGRYFNPPFAQGTRKAVMLAKLPSYAREEAETFRQWKVNYIRQNRKWWKSIERRLPAHWRRELASLPASFRKLEWNVKGGERDLWNHILQFRPSGLRAKRYTTAPALVAMTATQIPILGPERRFLTRAEGRMLQGFPESHQLPASRIAAFRALGNAVHVGVVKIIAAHFLTSWPTYPATRRGDRREQARPQEAGSPTNLQTPQRK